MSSYVEKWTANAQPGRAIGSASGEQMHSKWVDFAFSSICSKTLTQPRQTGSRCNIEPPQTLHDGGTHLPRQEYLSLSATCYWCCCYFYFFPSCAVHKLQTTAGYRCETRCKMLHCGCLKEAVVIFPLAWSSTRKLEFRVRSRGRWVSSVSPFFLS